MEKLIKRLSETRLKGVGSSNLSATLPLNYPYKVKMLVAQRVWFCAIPRTIVGQSMALFCPSNYPGWSGNHSLLQGIFLTQESNLGLPHCRQILYLSHQGSPSLQNVSLSPPRLGHIVFEARSLLHPPLPGEAIKLFFSTSLKTLFPGFDSATVQRHQ